MEFTKESYTREEVQNLMKEHQEKEVNPAFASEREKFKSKISEHENMIKELEPFKTKAVEYETKVKELEPFKTRFEENEKFIQDFTTKFESEIPEQFRELIPDDHQGIKRLQYIQDKIKPAISSINSNKIVTVDPIKKDQNFQKTSPDFGGHSSDEIWRIKDQKNRLKNRGLIK